MASMALNNKLLDPGSCSQAVLQCILPQHQQGAEFIYLSLCIPHLSHNPPGCAPCAQVVPLDWMWAIRQMTEGSNNTPEFCQGLIKLWNLDAILELSLSCYLVYYILMEYISDLSLLRALFNKANKLVSNQYKTASQIWMSNNEQIRLLQTHACVIILPSVGHSMTCSVVLLYSMLYLLYVKYGLEKGLAADFQCEGTSVAGFTLRLPPVSVQETTNLKNKIKK